MIWQTVSFRHHPLGARLPGGPHSVLSSLPTLRDVIGYETGDPETLRHLRSGYPRFLTHEFVRAVGQAIAADRPGTHPVPVADAQAADRLIAFVGAAGARVHTEDGFAVALLRDSAYGRAQAKAFTQHTGVLITSRQAEDWLAGRGMLAAIAPEEIHAGDASSFVRAALARENAPATAADVLLTRAGANAAYAAHAALAAAQARRGRTTWLQLGWLYVDTGSVLQEFAPDDAAPITIADPRDLDALAALLAARSDIAGIVCEAPSNPLLQTPDLARLAGMAREHGVALVVDPTVGGAGNVHVLPHADVVVTSLTKYAAREADVMLGAIVINPASPFAAGLRDALPDWIAAPYPRDVARLAGEMRDMGRFIDQVNANALALTDWLSRHPRVRNLRHPGHPDTRGQFLAIARSADTPGAMLSFSVDLPLARFYDRLALAKAASFGAEFTIVCPFLYLAHYDLVSTTAGRATLTGMGIDPDLVRVSVGIEPIGPLIDAFDTALGL